LTVLLGLDKASRHFFFFNNTPIDLILKIISYLFFGIKFILGLRQT